MNRLKSNLCAFTVLCYAFSSYAHSYTRLDPYQETMNQEQVEANLKLLTQNEEYVKSFLMLTNSSLTIYNDASKKQAEYEFRFGSKEVPSFFKPSKDHSLEGLKLALNARDGASLPIAEAIKEQVLEMGIRAEDVLISKHKALRDINEEINAFGPHIALVIQEHGSHFIGFVPGCFMSGELDQERMRVRFMHNLVSGKLTNSLKLAQSIAGKMNQAFGKHPFPMRKREFEGSTCGIPAPQGGNLPSLGTRNLFINGVLAPAVVYAFTGVTAELANIDSIARSYVDAIVESLAP